MCNFTIFYFWFQPLGHLKKMDLWGSKNLKEIPDLSKATSLEKLDLKGCSSLVELPSSISKLNKLTELNMPACTNLETLPTGMNLESLNRLNLKGCTRLRIFPNISRNISELILDETSITEFPSNLYLENLNLFSMEGIKSEKLWERAQVLSYKPKSFLRALLLTHSTCFFFSRLHLS